jgi:tight adherence protein B
MAETGLPLDQTTLMMIVGAGSLFVALLLGFAFAGGGNAGAHTKRRLSEVGTGPANEGIVPKNRNSARRVENHSSIKSLDAILRKALPRPAELRARLEKTGFKISISEYVLMNFVMIGLLAFLINYVFGYALFVAVPAGMAGGLFLPHFIIGFLGKRRVNKFMKTFPEAIELMVRGLRAGLPISETINVVGNDAPDPVGAEFRGVADAVRVGKTMEEALWNVASRIDVPDFKFLIIAISIQRETGGNLAETLSGLANTLRKRRQIKLKIKAMSSEARASAWIIGSLPFIMFFLLWLANDQYVMTLVEDPRGAYMIGAGLSLIGTGVGIMAKMVRFEI